MHVSVSGREVITLREGRRLVAYLDSVGVATIGVGHTGRMAPPAVHLGMTITAEQCDAFLAADLAPVEAAINGLGRTLTQNQFDALASFAFNIGVPGFLSSSVAARVKAGRMPEAADALLLWEKPAVLKARREAERHQFLTPDATARDSDLIFTPPPAAPAHPASAPASAAAPSVGSAPAPVAKASVPAQGTIMLNPISTLSTIATFAHSAISIATGLGTAAPALAKGAQSIVSSGSAVVADLGKVKDDLVAGKYANEPADIEQAVTDLGNAVAAVEKEAEAIAALAGSSSTLPSLSGISNLLAKI